MIRSVGEDVEKLKEISIVSWNVNWLKNSLIVLQNFKRTTTIWPSNYNYTPRTIPKRRELCPLTFFKIYSCKHFENKNRINASLLMSKHFLNWQIYLFYMFTYDITIFNGSRFIKWYELSNIVIGYHL